MDRDTGAPYPIKALSFAEAKARLLDDGPGFLEGYASKFGGVDSYGDTVLPGAYADTLPAFLKQGFVAWQHDWFGPAIAMPVEAREDGYGLWVKAQFHTTPFAQERRTEIAERLAAGKEMGLSIGYEALDFEYRGDIRALKRVRLFEWSPVYVPADPGAYVGGVKGGERFASAADRLLAEARTFVDRSRSLASLRAKEGRVLSAANREKLASLLESLSAVQAEIEALLAATEPKASPQEARRLLADFQRIQARLHGVAV